MKLTDYLSLFGGVPNILTIKIKGNFNDD